MVKLTRKMKNKGILAWHFTGKTLRDGREIPAVGTKLTQKGRLRICEYGFHGSIKLRDALTYAPGCMLHRVRLSGTIRKGLNKGVASERTILWSLDTEELLWGYARWCVLQVVHLWVAPPIVVQYLTSGDMFLKAAARCAAQKAAWAAAQDTVWADVQSAVWYAAWAAAR